MSTTSAGNPPKTNPKIEIRAENQDLYLKESPPTDTDGDESHFGAIPWFVRSGRGWEKWWFRKGHRLCEKCALACKQSAKVKVIRCPQYEARAVRGAENV